MKTQLYNLLFSFLILFCGGCQDSSPSRLSPLEVWIQNNGKLKVLSTTAMIDDLVGQIGEGRVDHLTLIQGELDPHSYELLKGDDEKLSFAQVVFYNGLGLEHGASLQYALSHHAHAVGVGSEIEKCAPQEILRVQGQIDPHVWMDISLWQKAIAPIVSALSKQDPEGASFYRERGDLLSKKMQTVHQELVEKFHQIPSEKRFLVTSHDAFHYFTRAYLAERGEVDWQKRCQAPEGLAPEGQLSVADIQKTISHLCAYRIGVVFPETNVSRDALKKIVLACVEKGHQVQISKEPLYGDAMGPVHRSSDASSPSYLGMIMHNSEVLIHAWQGEKE